MAPFKRKPKFLIVIFLLVFSLVGCNEEFNQTKLNGKIILRATVSMVGKNSNDIKEPHKIYSQKNVIELQTFVHAINKAKKIDGIVDVTTPNYLLIFTFRDKTTSKYSLWLGDDGGSIMNENNTHTMYTLPLFSIDDLNKYVK